MLPQDLHAHLENLYSKEPLDDLPLRVVPWGTLLHFLCLTTFFEEPHGNQVCSIFSAAPFLRLCQPTVPFAVRDKPFLNSLLPSLVTDHFSNLFSVKNFQVCY